MSPKSEYRLLKRQTNNFIIPITVGDAIQILNRKQATIATRKAEKTDRQLDHEIFIIEADRCNNILKDLT